MSSERQFKPITVASITADISRVRLAPLESGFTFKPGQYVEILCPEKSEWLACSIVNLPSDTGEIELVLRHHPAMATVNTFLTTAEQNSTVTIKGPLGRCTLPEGDTIEELVLVAGGTGIAPHLSLLLSKPKAKKIHLFWGARKVIDFYCFSALEAFCDSLPNFTYTLVLSEMDTTWSGKTGLIHEAIQASYPRFSKQLVYASGPFPMVENLWSTCQEKGLPATQFFSDMMPDN